MVGNVKLLVKSPNSKFQEKFIDCPEDWLISDLKRHLSSLLNIEFSLLNKLVFYGNLLPDDELLGNAFKQNVGEEVHVIYFVTSSTQPQTPTYKHTECQNETLRRRNVVIQPLPPLLHSTDAANDHPGSTFQSSFPVTLPESSTGLQYPIFPPILFSHNSSIGLTGLSMMDQSADYASLLWSSHQFSQIMWMQQAYAEYINQYQQYLRDANPHHGSTTTESISPPPNVNDQQEIPPDQQRPAQVMNAQGGAFLLDDGEDGRNRDWLDWAYVVMRFIMLMCILYFYSTPARFVTFVVASILFFVYQAGWLTIPFFRRQNDIQRQEHDVGTTENTNGQGGRNDEETDGIVSRFISTLWSIIFGFFVSLAPQAPPPININ